MKTVVIIVAALAVFWIVFFVAPGIVAYFTVFSRRKTASFEEVAATEYFKPYIGAIGAAKKRLESLGGNVSALAADKLGAPVLWGSREAPPEYFVLVGAVLTKEE